MQTSTRLNFIAAQFSLWTAQNPAAVRIVLIALPLVVAVVTALATQQPVFACTSQSGCTGGD